MAERTHVVVIGAGMAGCAAARDLVDAGRDVVVLEARDRIGGRIFTDHDLADGLAVEQGAEFIHTDRAETLSLARDAGFELAFCNPADGYRMHMHGVWDPELYGDPSLSTMGDLMGAIESFSGPDQSAAQFIEPRALTGVARAMAEQMLTVHPLGDLWELSMQGLVDDRVVELERGVDHRVVAGYDELPKFLARGVDVRLDTPVVEIAWRDDGVDVITAAGDHIVAQAAVCTLPVGVLKSRTVRFTPDLPTSKWDALAGLDMGAALKVIVRFSERFWDESLTMLGCDGPVRLYWTPLFGRTDAPAVLTAYVGGWRARALSALDEADAIATVLADLDRLFPDVRPSTKVERAIRVDWLTDPWSRGAYSFQRVGGAGSRAKLAASDTGALLWAGDATTTTTIAAVVHAAYVTGRRAAAEAITLTA